VRAACDGDLLVLKGPETAAAYPDPGLRAYGDIDLLASDAPSVQRAVIEAGFEPVGDVGRYEGLHHLRPLRPPRSPLLVEVHRAPAWPDGLPAPSTAELIEVAVPARCGVEGVLGLPPAHHAVLLAAHAWCHAPLGHLRQLLDIGLVAADAAQAELARLAERWHASRLWRTTLAALGAVFGDGRQPLALRLWARHLGSVRERTVLEAHLRSWLSPLWYLPAAQALSAAVAALGADLQPLRGERWNDKLRRTRLALANAGARGSRHDAMLRRNGGS
jgi:hypothetical protein